MHLPWWDQHVSQSEPRMISKAISSSTTVNDKTVVSCWPRKRTETGRSTLPLDLLTFSTEARALLKRLTGRQGLTAAETGLPASNRDMTRRRSSR